MSGGKWSPLPLNLANVDKNVGQSALHSVHTPLLFVFLSHKKACNIDTEIQSILHLSFAFCYCIKMASAYGSPVILVFPVLNTFAKF